MIETRRFTRPHLREAFLRADVLPNVYFYTSNEEKFLQAKLVFERSGLNVTYFKTRTDPYSEDYSSTKQVLLTKATAAVASTVGATSIFFIEDTSLRIDALSNADDDFPGLAVKEWFAEAKFEQLDANLKARGDNRRAVIKSDIALHLPGIKTPCFFSGESHGVVANNPPDFAPNIQYPWLTPRTFNGWFIPDGTSKHLGAMSIEESWEHDFRIQALEQMLNRLEEYTAIMNLPTRAYARVQGRSQFREPALFGSLTPRYIVVGHTCAGKTTFGEYAARAHRIPHIEASHVLRTLHDEQARSNLDPFEFASQMLKQKGPDAVARQLLHLYEKRLDQGFVVTGFRTVEEVDLMKSTLPGTQLVWIEAAVRIRYQRHLARGRAPVAQTLGEFRNFDKQQASFGLLRVAKEFADIKISNEGTMKDYESKIDALLASKLKSRAGISTRVRPRHGTDTNQLFRCLETIEAAGRPLSCDEIQRLTKTHRKPIRQNNANKVLKAAPEFAERLELPSSRVRYQITNAGRAYVRLVRALQQKDEKHSLTSHGE